MQPHQHDESQHFGLVGQQTGNQAGQPHRILREVAARRHLRPSAQVALIEHEVQNREHPVHAGHQLGALGHSVRDVRFHDLPFGAHDSLGHRRLGDEKRGRDLLGGESRDCAQRERHLRFLGKGRMAAREDQAQPVVRFGRFSRHRRTLQECDFLRVALVAAQQVDGAAPRRRHQPRAGVVRDSLGRPILQRRDQAVLDDLLRDVEVADEAHHRAGELRGLFAEHCRECRIGGFPCLGQALIVPQRARPRQARRAMPWPSRVPRRDP